MGAVGSRREQDLSGQSRNMLVIEPLDRLQSDANVRGQMLSAADAQEFRLDLRLAALSMLDFVMEETAFQPGADPDAVVLCGVQTLREMSPAMPEESALKLARSIFGRLRNQTNRFEEFRIEYYDAASRTWRYHPFRYLDTFPDPEDTTRVWVQLAPGGKKLLLGMLDVADDLLEDAERHIMRKALDRERYDDALKAAFRARQRSADYKSKIEALVMRAKRDSRSVSWGGDGIGALLDEAARHIEARLVEDRDFAHRLDDKIRDAQEPDHKTKLVELRETVQGCVNIHGGLSRLVMTAASEIRAAKMRGFRSRVVADCRDPEEEILMPLLSASVGRAAADADLILAAFSATEIPVVFDLPALLGDLMAVREAAPEAAPDDEADVLEAIAEPQGLFSPERIALIADWMGRQVGGSEEYRLSEVVERAVTDGFDRASLRLLVLTAVQPLGIPPDERPTSEPRLAWNFEVGGAWSRESLGGDDILFRRAS